MKYVSRGPLLVNVYMHNPTVSSRSYMDSLLAFWPGLQVLNGDLKAAIETHEVLYQLIEKHKFLPEAFTQDFDIHWTYHPLRPEFVESTYFLYKLWCQFCVELSFVVHFMKNDVFKRAKANAREHMSKCGIATKDPYYLSVGEKVIRSMNTFLRIPCGFAGIGDLRTMRKEDRMDSYLLAETFKYLFLLYAEREDLIFDIDDFVFTTEGHLLPLKLSSFKLAYPKEPAQSSVDSTRKMQKSTKDSRTCMRLPPVPIEYGSYARSVRNKLKNFVHRSDAVRYDAERLFSLFISVCFSKTLHASEFDPTNPEHHAILKTMGISTVVHPGGRVHLVHSADE
ncbi:unnamed protein product, partial [Soboliphyme baturini]|uniref:alpha-1,2-Mannosidase n=1 Tax=Soboliphyme baturini TaxID=241478 RepID=A0A183J5S0_9BILA